MVSSLASLVLTGAVTLVIYKIVTWFQRYKKWAALYGDIPTTQCHWLLGHLFQHPGTGQEGINHIYSFVKPFPKMFKYWMTALDCIVVMHHPDSVKKILKSPATVAPKPRDFGGFYGYALPWLGDGLLIANGEKWLRQRRLLTPAFHFDILQPYVRVYNETVEIMMNKLERSAESGSAFDLYEPVGLLALDNMLRCALSSKDDCQQRENHPYVVAVKRLTLLWAERAVNAFYVFDWIFSISPQGREFQRHCDYVHQVTDDIIKSRQQEVNRKDSIDNENSPKSRYLDFLDLLLVAKDEDGKTLTDLEIRDEVDTFLFEGHDTTTSGLAFTLMSLAQHPSIQRKVQDEIDQILDGRDSDEIGWKDLPKLEYTSMCIKEGMRMNPPVHFIQRYITEDIDIDGCKVPKGASVGINIRNLHHNPVVWGEDHWEYKPERFLPQNSENRDPFAFCPFAGGPRNCIGQSFAMNEMRVSVARILRRYTLEIAPEFNENKVMAVILRPENGIQVKVKRRS